MNKELVVIKDTLPSVLPLLPLETSAVMPGLMASMQVARGKSVRAVDRAVTEGQMVGLLIPRQKLEVLPSSQDSSDSPELLYRPEDLFNRGVSARILKKILLPDGSMNLLVYGVQRFEVAQVLQSEPFLAASVHYFAEKEGKETDAEIEALSRNVIMQVKQLSETNPYFTEEMKLAMINVSTAGALADLVAFALGLKQSDAQSYIETTDVKERFLKLLVFLRKEKDLSDLQRKLNTEVDSRVNKLQRDYFLREQLKTIKKELGLEEDDKSRETKSLREKIQAAGLPEHALKIANEEMNRLQTIPETSPEFNLTRNYIDWIASLPWSKASKDNLDLANARKVLNRGHYGLEKVKDRILEFLAVRKLKPEFHGSILCFVGPPGVGKTSLGKSIAESLGREFFRFSLGGMRDEAEIKGHRRTYVGALPGKILQGMKRAGTHNPVILLDEVDKVGMSYQGDPASALLEVLDPEQNVSFLDHYLDIPYDLSKALFIATANTLTTVPPALLDRMEIIELPGYTLEEKLKIAKTYVIPRGLDKHGLAPADLALPNDTIQRLLKDYAREPGIRSLQQQVDKICRRVARTRVENPRARLPITVRAKDLENWLGPQRFYNEVAAHAKEPGVVTGMAWTSAGGDILFIEALATEGKGELKLTGQMGEVMVESAKIALSHVKKHLSNQKQLKIHGVRPNEWFQRHDIHLHIPAGAVPKDGPSAGITMATALLSLATERVAKPRIAMTGELSLTGKVLPVGGIKEKVLAAKRAGITDVVLPRLNQKDLKEIAPDQQKGLKFHFAGRVEDVYRLALSARA